MQKWKPHLWEDKNKVIHLCESDRIHPGILLVWTKCGVDVPANESFQSHDSFETWREEISCKKCLPTPPKKED